MKTVLIADATALKAGDLVVGPSALAEIRRLVDSLPDQTEYSVKNVCRRHGVQLYEVLSVVDKRFLWRRKRFAMFRRYSDKKKIRISLDQPKFDFFAKSPPIDLRLDWAKLEFPATSR